MKITAQQRKALEAAGYTVGKSGNTVQKDGKTVGGYNANGQMFSGSSKIKDILKAKPEAEAKPAARATSAPAPRASRASQPAPRRPAAKAGGRGDGNYERVVRGANAAINRATADKPPSVMSTSPRQPATPKPIPNIVRQGSKSAPPPSPTPRPTPAPAAKKEAARSPMNNPISRAATAAGKKIGEMLNGKSRRKPVKLDPKANKHPYD